MMQRPRLYAGVVPVPLESGEIACHSETGTLCLRGSVFPDLLPLLDGRHTVGQIGDALGPLAPEVVCYHLLLLEKAGLLEEAGASADPASLWYRQMACPEAAPARSPFRVALTSWGELPLEPLLGALQRLPGICALLPGEAAAAPGEDLRIAVVADYHDPRLSAFAAHCLRDGVPWLPFKPVGVQLWLGPLFVPGGPACWDCLIARLRGLNFLEAARAAEVPFPVLSAASLGRTTATCHLGAALAAQWVDLFRSGLPQEPFTTALHTLDLRSMSLDRHRVPRWKVCPACSRAVARGKAVLPSDPFPPGEEAAVVHRQGGWRTRTAEQTLDLLLPLIDPLTGIVSRMIPMPDAPPELGHCYQAWYATCRVRERLGKGRWSQQGACAGKGRTPAQAKVSALAEAVERYCSQWQGNRDCRRASWKEMAVSGEPCIHPHSLMLFSQKQYETRAGGGLSGTSGFVPCPLDEDAPMDWIPAWSLTCRRWAWVPAAYVYYGYPAEGGGGFIRGDSNGVAAGNNRLEAALQGLLELVERDAVAIWWYNRQTRPGLVIPPEDPLHKAARWPDGSGSHLRFLDLTHDLGVPVFAATAAGDDLPEPLFGFGAHPDPRIALERAITEAGQGMALHLTAGEKRADPSTGEPLCRMAFLRPDPDLPPTRLAAPPGPGESEPVELHAGLTKLVGTLSRKGLETLLVDLSQPEAGLSVVRMMVPGLRHFWPRLAPGRLYDVPVELGWRAGPKTENELNPLAVLL